MKVGPAERFWNLHLYSCLLMSSEQETGPLEVSPSLTRLHDGFLNFKMLLLLVSASYETLFQDAFSNLRAICFHLKCKRKRTKITSELLCFFFF